MITVFLIFLLAIAAIVVASRFYVCKAATKQKVLNVEQCILEDKEYMVLHYGDDFKWYETSITAKGFYNEDYKGIEVVTNVFQTLVDDDPLVVIFTHTESKDDVQQIHSFWVEDFPMNGAYITYEEALERINKVNFPKPHSKFCVLRKEVGPKEINPQYIFGNQHGQLYVDSINGNVTDKNPAFDK